MRILFAKLLVGFTGLMIVALAVLFAVIRNSSEGTAVAPATSDASSDATSQDPQAATAARGRAVYAAQRCRMCHAIEGDGNTRSPLDGVGARLTEREIRLWIVSPQEMNPAVAKRGYQLSEEDLDALVAYLKASAPLFP